MLVGRERSCKKREKRIGSCERALFFIINFVILYGLIIARYITGSVVFLPLQHAAQNWHPVRQLSIDLDCLEPPSKPGFNKEANIASHA